MSGPRGAAPRLQAGRLQSRSARRLGTGRAWRLRLTTLLVGLTSLVAAPAFAETPHPTTFSIVAADPETGEVGVAVASRFFAVGTVVPWAQAGVGAVATQSFANTGYGPRGLELMRGGLSAAETVDVLTRTDEGRAQRQLGLVTAAGDSATFTGESCLAWAGGRSGPGYAVQGNILTGADVVAEMERAFLESSGQPLAERLYAALAAGDDAGGDSRGKQSAALMVAREKGGYGGYNDRAIDVRVDDHASPLAELGRLLGIALVNDYWNRGWTAFQEKRYEEALEWQERTATSAESAPGILPEVLYDLAVIRLAAGDSEGAATALERAVELNPKLATQAELDDDLGALKRRGE